MTDTREEPEELVHVGVIMFSGAAKVGAVSAQPAAPD